jgi:hypothetical protein
MNHPDDAFQAADAKEIDILIDGGANGLRARVRGRCLMSLDPVLIAYTVTRSRDGKRTYWRRIGCAVPHETGSGLTVLLDAIPLTDRIVLLEPDVHDEKRLLERLRSLSTDSFVRK